MKHILINKALTWQWLGFAAIAFFVFLVYFPSLMHVPRGDQLMYLGEVAQQHGFKELAINDYDLNRHRTINPGDELLFRPILYFVLGAEKFFFGYHFLGWQLVGILLHLTVIWQMLRLLSVISSGAGAALATAFFALMFANMEMVVWHHINSYLVAVTCLLIILRQVYGVLYHDEDFVSKRWLIMACLLIGGFTYELINIYAVLIFVVLWQQRPSDRRYLWVLLWPVIAYAVASWANMMVNHYQAPEGLYMAHAINVFDSLSHLWTTVIFWIYAGLFPTQLDMTFAARNMITEGAPLIKPLVWTNLVVALMLGVLILLGIPTLLGRFKTVIGRRFAWFFLLGMMVLIYALVIVGGRENSRGMMNVLRADIYYIYIFWVLITILLYSLIDQAQLHRWQKIVVAIYMAVVIAANGGMLFSANDYQAKENNAIIVLVNTLEMLIQERGGEKDFSFYVDEHYPGNYVYKEFHKVSDLPGRNYSIAEILYPQYFNQQHPKYKFLVSPQP